MTNALATTTTNPIQTLFTEEQPGFSMTSSIERDIVGILFDSALLTFLLTQTPAAQKSFETWVQIHASEPTFLSDICVHYPHFYEILQTEILNARL